MVELLEVIPQGLGMVLVMEFLPMSLYDLLHNVDYRINQSEIKCYVKMILMGVKYLHENDIMHRVSCLSSKVICKLRVFFEGFKTG